VVAPPDLSIVIPAYMEGNVIGASLERLAEFLDSRDYGGVEVLVVVADSPDGTAEIATRRAGLFSDLRVIHAGCRRGKGRDTRLGMFEARGRYRMFMDADLATPLHYLDDVADLMRRDAAIGIAVRDLLTTHRTWARRLLSKCANLAAQVLVVPGVKDTQCGFKVFEASVAEATFGRMTMLSWSFDMELLAIARSLRYRIDLIDVPDWADPKVAGDGLVGDSHIRVVLDGFLDPFRIRLNVWRGRYRTVTYQHQPLSGSDAVSSDAGTTAAAGPPAAAPRR
jgi:dolichyl-phosphate beta-glucosyltransferase